MKNPSLDAETESKIQEAIKNLIKDRTTLVIAHRLSTIVNSKIYMLFTKEKNCRRNSSRT